MDVRAQERYIGGPTGGIPDRIFQPGIKEVFQAVSGTRLSGTTTKSEISLLDTTNKKLCFHARHDPRTDLIRFTVNNKGWNGARRVFLREPRNKSSH